MEIIIKPDYEEMSREAAGIIQRGWEKKKSLVLGLPTGRTPLGLYEKLVELYHNGEMDFSDVTTFNVDEYLGLDETHPQSFAFYMENHLFRHVNIKKENINHLSGKPDDIREHCHAYEMKIRRSGGIDIQVLGIGTNGHVAFNEPSSSLSSRTRLEALAQESIKANAYFFRDETEVPRFCLTMGVGTFLDSKMILLLASGKDKAKAVAGAIEGPITASNPASALQLHPQAKFVIDEEAASKLIRKDYYRWKHENRSQASELLKKWPDQ
jgi:glucosamine-6-phosphate deaminase